MKDATIDKNYLISFSKTTKYLWNYEYECFVKSVPGNGFWAKFPGKPEYPINSESNIVVLAIYGGQFVSKESYDKA